MPLSIKNISCLGFQGGSEKFVSLQAVEKSVKTYRNVMEISQIIIIHFSICWFDIFQTLTVSLGQEKSEGSQDDSHDFKKAEHKSLRLLLTSFSALCFLIVNHCMIWHLQAPKMWSDETIRYRKITTCFTTCGHMHKHSFYFSRRLRRLEPLLHDVATFCAALLLPYSSNAQLIVESSPIYRSNKGASFTLSSPLWQWVSDIQKI